MLIDFKDLFIKQKELDLDIQQRHNVTYENTMSRRSLSLLVEIGELANATRCFKYWSNKPSESKERVYDEYADGLHFLLSLGIALNVKVTNYMMEKAEEDLTYLFLAMYDSVLTFVSTKDEKDYVKSFEIYLKIADKLGMSKDDIFESYLLKLGENYHRQETNY